MPINMFRRKRQVRLLNHLRFLDRISCKRSPAHSMGRTPNLLNTLSDEQFRMRFRLDKDSALEFYEDIKENFPPYSHGNRKLDGFNQFLIALYYLANGNFQLTCGNLFRISQPVYSRCVSKVFPMIARLSKKYITFPDTVEKIQEAKEGFISRARLPDCIGAIDGTHIPLQLIGLPKTHMFYSGYKKFNSLNCMIVCDSYMKILNVVARWHGSVHDSTIFRLSALKEKLESTNHGGYIIGDKAYPCTEYLMTPITNPANEIENEYNIRHKKARVAIEQLFGMIKKMFGFVKGPVRTCMRNTLSGIVAACVLWNFLNNRNKYYAMADQEIEESDEDEAPLDSLHQPLQFKDTRWKQMRAAQLVQMLP